MIATPTIDMLRASGRWNPLWDRLAEWDPTWAETFLAAACGPWTDGVLPAKTIELLCIAGDASCTHQYAPGTRRHIRAALDLGATREEILVTLQLTSLVGLQACELGLPLLDEALGGDTVRTADELLSQWDPQWAAHWEALAESICARGALDAKTLELLAIGINAAATHMNACAVRRHISRALVHGATRAEILAILKVASVVGIHACNLGVPILAEELAARRGEELATVGATSRTGGAG